MTPESELALAPQPASRNGDDHSELDARVRRLEDQLATLRTQQAVAHTSDGGGNPFANVAGMVLPLLTRFGGSGLPSEPGSKLSALAEFRLIARMYVDPHYRVSRVAQFGVPAVLIAMVLNNLFWPSIPLLTPVLMQLMLVVLSVTLYKLLSREAGRYAEVLSYLNRHGQGAR